jgi:hypothetical protein
MATEAYITGVGQSQIGQKLLRHPLLLTLDALKEALDEAGLTIDQIDGVATYPGRMAGYLGFSPVGADDVIEAFGIKAKWRLGGMELSAQLGAIAAAADAVKAGHARHVMCFRTVYEAAAMARPDDVRHVTEILEDGRYAMACVRARVDGRPLPTRRPPCFFDPRHGLSVEDVPYAPLGGADRQVPACALDAERVKAGAEPDARQVMVGTQRVPYWQGGRAYRPYAAGYFGGFGVLDWLFMGMMFNMVGGGLGELAAGVGEGMGDMFDGIGDMAGDIGDGIGNVFDGFDF